MSVAQLERSLDIASQEAPVTQDSKMGVQLSRAIKSMTEHCETHHNQAKFIAKGLVVDTLGDVRQQIIDYFPRRIDVQPVLDDIAREVGMAAKKSGQQYQEVSFLYVSDNKALPKQAEAGRQFAVKIYGQDGAAEGIDYSGMSHTLKPPGSGAGGSGMDLLQFLNCALKQVFALVISAVDVDDIRILQQQISPNVVQALGGTPDAMRAMQSVMTGGGNAAVAAESVLSAINTSTALQQALYDAPTPAHAQNITAALAYQAETLSASLPIMAEQLPAPVMREITRQLDNVKTDVSAQKAAYIVNEITQPHPQAANSPYAPVEPYVAQAAHKINDIATTHNMSVADVMVLAKVDTAPVHVKHSVHNVMEQINHTPVLAEKMIAPIAIEPQVIVQQLQKLAEQAPVLVQSAQVLEAVMAPTPVSYAVSSIAQPLQVQSVADNLQALQQSQYIQPEVKAQLAVITPQIDVIVQQAPLPINVPTNVVPEPAPHVPVQPTAPHIPVQYDPAPITPAPYTPVQPNPVQYDPAPITPVIPNPLMPNPVMGDPLPTHPAHPPHMPPSIPPGPVDQTLPDPIKRTTPVWTPETYSTGPSTAEIKREHTEKRWSNDDEPRRMADSNVYSFTQNKSGYDNNNKSSWSNDKGYDSHSDAKHTVKTDSANNNDKIRTASFVDALDRQTVITGVERSASYTTPKTSEKSSKCAACFNACNARGTGICPAASAMVANMHGPRPI